jgi:hypothetical protein
LERIQEAKKVQDETDRLLFEQVQKLAGAFQLKNEEEIRLVLKIIEDAPKKETPTELRIRIVESIKNFRAQKTRDPWPNKAEKKNTPQKDPGMAVLNGFTPKERNLVISGKKTIEEVQIARKYKEEKREMRIKLKMKKAQERREIREAKKAIKRLTKKRLKKITPKAKKRNEFGHKLGSWQDFLDQLFKHGYTIKEAIEKMNESDLFKKFKAKKLISRFKGHTMRLKKKGFEVQATFCPKPKSVPKAERILNDFYKVVIKEEKESEEEE